MVVNLLQGARYFPSRRVQTSSPRCEPGRHREMLPLGQHQTGLVSQALTCNEDTRRYTDPLFQDRSFLQTPFLAPFIPLSHRPRDKDTVPFLARDDKRSSSQPSSGETVRGN
jgi:hypothetical protein